MSILEDKIRPFNPDTDSNLPTFSYSKFDVYKKCPMQYKFKYIDKHFDHTSTLPMELGTLCHYILELKCTSIKEGNKVDYDSLESILINGSNISEADTVALSDNEEVKTKESVIGLNDIKKKYFEDYYIADKFGTTYETKIKTFKKILRKEMEDKEWIPFECEHPFKFVYDNKIIIHGFIDRIDINKDGDFRVVDYKTSKAVFLDKELPTSLQFGIYALGMLNEYKKVPIEYDYRFIFIDKEQQAMTKGWENRLIKALDKLILGIENDETSTEYVPKPTQLCHWCSFCKTNQSGEYKGLCNFYMEWTPQDKTFNVHRPFTKGVKATENGASKTRKLIF